jgi:hypothetical protein
MMQRVWLTVASLSVILTLTCVASFAEETLITSIDLPGASVSQQVTYNPSKAIYVSERDTVLRKLREGDNSARVNPVNGAWMRAETTATIGISYQGVGVAQGRVNVRQITAAEEALYRFQQSGGR